MDVFATEEEVIDLRQGREYARYMHRRGWVVERVSLAGDRSKKVYVVVKRLPLISVSVMKCQRFAGELDLEDIKKVKREYRVVYTVWEPLEIGGSRFCKKQGWKTSKTSYLPSKTLVVDLNKSVDNLWSELSKDARQTISRNSNSVVARVTNAKQRVLFWKKWKKAKKGYTPGYREFLDLTTSFGKKCWLIELSNNNEMVAGVVVLVSNGIAYYYFAWTNERGRELGAQYKLVWESMMMAKKEGLSQWDFEGIEDERSPRKSWVGFSQFKKKFGGTSIKFPKGFRSWL